MKKFKIKKLLGVAIMTLALVVSSLSFMGAAQVSVNQSDVMGPYRIAKESGEIATRIMVGQTMLPIQLQAHGYANAVLNVPPTWAVTIGELPAGVYLNAETGEISGTPTILGTSVFHVSAGNAGGSITERFVIHVVPSENAVADAVLVDGVDTYNHNTVSVTGGANVSFDLQLCQNATSFEVVMSDTLSEWLDFETNVTVVGGNLVWDRLVTFSGNAPIVTSDTPSEFVFAVVSSNGTYTSTKTIAIFVNRESRIEVTPSLSVENFFEDETPSVVFTNYGTLNKADVIFEVTNNGIDWVELSTVTSWAVGSWTISARLCETNTTHEFSAPVKAAFEVYERVIDVAPVITTSTNNSAFTRNLGSFSFAFAATGNPTPTWFIDPPAQIAGDFTFNSTTGLLEGTFNTVGRWYFAVRVENFAGYDERVFVINVSQATQNLPDPVVGLGWYNRNNTTFRTEITRGVETNIDFIVTAGGNHNDIVFSLAVGTLPEGFAWCDTYNGRLIATPTERGVHTFVIRAANERNSVTQAFVIDVANPAVTGHSIQMFGWTYGAVGAGTAQQPTMIGLPSGVSQDEIVYDFRKEGATSWVSWAEADFTVGNWTVRATFDGNDEYAGFVVTNTFTIDSASGSNLGVILGGTIGGLVFLGLVGLALLWFLKRRKSKEKEPIDATA